MNQQSNNPTVYTKLSCFLPWIAKQYNLKFLDSGASDETCKKGTGNEFDIYNPEDTNSKYLCRNVPTKEVEVEEKMEVECLFPFYYDGQLIDNCIKFVGIFPTYVCPIKNVTTKFPGTQINSFNSKTLLARGFCQDFNAQKPDDLFPPLNPFMNCSAESKRVVFSQCKNNCPGGDHLHLFLYS